MRIRYAAFVFALTVAAVTGIVGGQFAVTQRFETSRAAAADPDGIGPVKLSAEAMQEFNEFHDSKQPANLSNRLFPRSRWKEQCGAQLQEDEFPGRMQVVANDAPPAEDDDCPSAPATNPQSKAAECPDGPQPRPGGIPDQLSHPEDASPIEADQEKRDQQTREIISEELQTATPEEREVWFEELKGLAPQMTRELLRLRKRIAPDLVDKFPAKPSLPTQRSESLSVPTVASPSGTGFPDYLPGNTTQTTAPALESSIAAMRMARDVVLNNIANAQTPGFQRSRVLFEDLAYRQIKVPGQPDLTGKTSTTDFSVGLGVQISGTERDTTPGKLEASHGDLHLAIIGNGYFQFQDGAEALYTRAGAFALNADGEIVLASSRRSRLLEPPITIPADATNVEISDEGIVSIRQPGSSSLEAVGHIQLARFVNPAGLEPRGENLLAATNASGAPQVGSPSLEGRGKLRQRCLEASNVNLEDELAELQRLQSRLVALEKARALLSSGAEPTTASPARIAESISR